LQPKPMQHSPFSPFLSCKGVKSMRFRNKQQWK
jgi:hypothetical protein